MVELLARNWGWIVLRGIVAILLGILTLLFPGLSLATLVVVFGAYAFVDGIFMIVSAIANCRGARRRCWSLLSGGLLGIGVGAGTVLMPGITAIALLAMIAAWAFVVGIPQIVTATRLRKRIVGGWLLILSGVLAVAFGAFSLVQPSAGAATIVLWIGAYAAASGILLITLGLKLRRFSRAPRLGEATT